MAVAKSVFEWIFPLRPAPSGTGTSVGTTAFLFREAKGHKASENRKRFFDEQDSRCIICEEMHEIAAN